MKRILLALLGVVLLSGCDQLAERAGIPNEAKMLAEGKAIGGACRHAGRGLEDCYSLNRGASKSAIYDGWKEMNEYMAKNNMQAVPPEINLKAKMMSKQSGGEGGMAAKTDTDDAHAGKSDGNTAAGDKGKSASH